MKKTLLAIIAGSFLFTACNNASSTSGKDIVLATELDSVAYALGCLTAQNYGENLSTEFNIDILTAAMKEQYGNDSAELLISLKDAEVLVNDYARAQYEAKANNEAQENLATGQAFLQANSTKEGVVTLPSGLQYKVITEGTGAKPGLEDKVSCHYTGRLIDGKVFDSSVQRGTPAEFGVTQVIPGWTEALQLMPVGSKWELYIPANLAYGERGSQGAIPPNATLIFELEILDIVK